ncbi:MAG TPA: DNA-formamidopyrimidine glycosylase family protein [Terracidiphilus sp.]|jgi:endonuclease-8|nr:DNA-formamidopyrimidine glycosylase family protein [Terracidiphilus sp.]
MPEGDTIFRTARNLGRALVGKPVTVFRSTYPLLTRFHEDTPLTGQLVDCVEARGKWLLIHFSGGGTLITHMLMNGSWHIYRHGERWQQPRFNMRIVIENGDYIAVGFRVPVAEMHSAQSLMRDRRIPNPEIDVLKPDFDAEEALRRVQAHGNEEIADVLLHQEVLAGVGNVFKSEICFVTGTNPFCKVFALSHDQLRALITTAQKLVGANVLEDSGNTIVTYGGRRRRTTHETDPGASLFVYGRKGEPCRRCGEPIRRRIQGPDARVTFWCRLCQPMPDGTEVDG